VTAHRDIWAVVPVKELAQAKSRLAGALADSARAELARAMLEDVLDALTGVRALAGIVVVTVDSTATSIASRLGARVFTDDATGGHTRAVLAAGRRLRDEGREGMLTLPGDIPGVRCDEVQRLLALHKAAPAFTIAPAHDRRGSNAIVLSPPTAVPLAFGNDSFLPHLAAARRAGIEPTIATGLDGIALDIDCGDDMIALLRTPRSTRARTVLMRHARTLA
jgi:2-phospho-L-lactate/phosphoenolpyruvate guanylyltransferase